MSALSQLLATFRDNASSEGDKDSEFEHLICVYLGHEPRYRDLYCDVLSYADWAQKQGLPLTDAGIDLVAETIDGQSHAILCRNNAADQNIPQGDIDRFFAASGKAVFAHRIIATTTDRSSDTTRAALEDQNSPVTLIDLPDLENSVIDWSQYEPNAPPVLKAKKSLRPHQREARNAVLLGLKTADRGKLIMPCGTGKTLTALKIAESVATDQRLVLFLVPSLAMLSQTLVEWSQESGEPLLNFAVCSDADGNDKRHQNDDDEKEDAEDWDIDNSASALPFLATTNAKDLREAFTKTRSKNSDARLCVIYSTYDSIDIVHEAQKLYGLPDFDLIICDEAHHTTGATYDGKGGLPFVRVHDNDFIRAKKRLYMTATPHIYMTPTRRNVESILGDGIELYPMDDEAIYGQNLYVLSFSNAVAQGLLVDYKVLIQVIDEEDIGKRLKSILTVDDSSNDDSSNDDNDIKLYDAAKIVACWKALAKHGLKNPGDPEPMKRAVAFCQLSENHPFERQEQVSSKQFADMFSAVVEAYQESEKNDAPQENSDDTSLKMVCRAQHVDASMNAGQKGEKLQWLKGGPKGEIPENECRILSNVRCLSNGVDVPDLDAIMYLNPRESQLDIVKSVGHVMRVTPGKQVGYIILPVVIPVDVSTKYAFEDERSPYAHYSFYDDERRALIEFKHDDLFKSARVVWQVLNALRAHDDRFDVMINRLEYNHRLPSQIDIILVNEAAPTRDEPARNSAALGAKQSHGGDINPNDAVASIEQELRFEADVYKRALLGTIVKHCKNRHHWAKWAKGIVTIARMHILRIKIILANKDNVAEIKAFNGFAEELRHDLNEAVTDNGVIELLAQHMITKPVFDAIFENDQFTTHNPMSQAIEALLAKLQIHRIDSESGILKAFFDSIKMHGAERHRDKNALIREINDKVFFESARYRYDNTLPQAMEELVTKLLAHRSDKESESFKPFCNAIKMRVRGIKSAEGKMQIFREIYDKIFRNAFRGMSIRPKIGSTPIEIVDFIIHSVEDILRSEFQSSLANDGVHILDPFAGTGIFITRLLESGIIPKDKLTHKYQYEIHANEDVLLSYYTAAANIEGSYHDIMSPQITDNKGDETQKNDQVYLPFRGICLSDSLHAYKNEGIFELKDNSARRKAQDQLDIAVIMSHPPSQTRCGDSYVDAIRWASKRIGDQGIVAFISDGAFIDDKASDGLRKYLAETYSSLYIFHLGGDLRTSLGRTAKFKTKILTSGSIGPDVISVLVKNPKHSERGLIYFYDIDENLRPDKKLRIIKDFGSIDGIDQKVGWTQFRPNIYHDWLKQRDPKFNSYVEMGTKRRKNAAVIFETYSNGLKTRRGPWIYNASKEKLQENVQKLIGAYDDSLQNYKNFCRNSEPENWHKFFKFSEPELRKLQWSDRFRKDLEQHKEHRYLSNAYAVSLYRPFTKQHVYYDPDFIEKVYQIPQIFPNAEAKNLLMILSPQTSTNAFSVLMTDALPDFNTIAKGQCFPLYHYESADEDETSEADNDNLSAQKDAGTMQHKYRRRDAISDRALAHFQAAYPKRPITKEALFYYVYGLLHSNDYHKKHAHDLRRQLPRIPRVASYNDFKAFSQIGRKLADLHINYESCELYPVRFTGKLKHNGHDFVEAEPTDFYVKKMRHPKHSCPDTGKRIDDLSRIVYNAKITIDGIPETAYDYIVNGKPAIEWVIKQQGANTHAASRIGNDTNDWAIETAKNPRYPLELLLRVISLSLKTMELVKQLPALDLLPE